MKKLPKEFKKKWLEALRSGDYKQGTSILKNNDRYCCLGVACSVAGYERTLDSYKTGYIDDKRRFKNVPEILKGGFENPITSELMDMNDSYDKNFNEIADWIEENL